MKKIGVLFFALFVFSFGLVMPGCTQEGSEAPEISAGVWFNSEGTTLADNHDKVVIVEFWATWCPPCRAIIPHLKELHETYKDQGVVLVSLSNEPEATVADFVKKAGMTWIIGAESNTGGDYGVRGIPASYIVVEGKIVWNGHPNGVEAKLKEILDSRK